ncbi:MAG: bifunctional riboflavin kinase/FAD synthetase [Flavobacteriales bacterium]|nr:bifunctional riboflavin kinase/FAD synthetase [Flavobacteriales bacterium]
MKVTNSLVDFKADKPVILTQGTFDGVHLGHQKILRTIIQRARDIDGEAVLLTFYPHPRLVLYPDDNELKLITTLEERISILEDMGLDQVVVLPFTKELARMMPMEYVRSILVEHLKTHTFIIGYDHRFGKNREGSIQDLKQFAERFAFNLEEIPQQDILDSAVSSSKVRRALLRGDVSLANLYLGRMFSLAGTVVHGHARGHDLGYPTANLHVDDPFKLIPANGVYAVRVSHKGMTYGGMLNIGDNPTFEDSAWSIEVNIFDFNEEIYGDQLRLYFVSRLRDELKFANTDELKARLAKDEIAARALLSL